MAYLNDKYKGQTVTGKVLNIEDNFIEVEITGDESENALFELDDATKYTRQSGTGGESSIYISEDSTWIVTGDSAYTITVDSYSEISDLNGAESL